MWEETFNKLLLDCLSHFETVANRYTISFIHSCSQTYRIFVVWSYDKAEYLKNFWFCSFQNLPLL